MKSEGNLLVDKVWAYILYCYCLTLILFPTIEQVILINLLTTVFE